MTAEAWRNRAACRGLPTDMFFPEVGGPGNGAEKALAICARCPVTAECRAFAERMEAQRGSQEHGVWGGTTAKARQRARRRRARKGAAA